MVVTGGLRLLVFAIAFARCVVASGGYDFSNNLFEDVAPLLALFGERVTMQFLSQSMGWADNFIMAMLPIGILTAVVSAIRVGGPLWLKAIIGRARENFAAAEIELMSSTSNEVCELWNGNDVVRCMGSAPITEFICLLPENMQSNGHLPKVVAIDLDTAIARGYLKHIGANDQDTGPEINPPTEQDESQAEKGEASTEPSTPRIIIVRDTSAHVPNISLNSHNMFERTELRIVAVFGTILQLGVLTFSAFVAYYPTKKFLDNGEHIPLYAFYCLVMGTCLLVLGVLLCAHVVETSSEETRYRPGMGKKARLIWLQKSKSVSDQFFDSFAIYPTDDRNIITTSHRADTRSEATRLALETIIGTMLGLAGFILQYVGLRGMHWSVLVAQLGAMLIMAGLRAWVRRGLVKPLQCERLTPGLELEWFSSQLGNLKTPRLNLSQSKETGDKDWRIMTGGSPTHQRLRGDHDVDEESSDYEESVLTCTNEDSKAHDVMIMRRDLGELADWRGPASEEAVAVARSMEVTMNALFFDSPAKTFAWMLKANHGEIHFRLEREQNGNWKAFSDEIEAALSLWLYSVNDQEHRQDDHHKERNEFSRKIYKDDKWLRAKGSSESPSLRLLGPNTPGLHRDLRWWMPHDTLPKLIEVEEAANGTLVVDDHRTVGYGTESTDDDNCGSVSPLVNNFGTMDSGIDTSTSSSGRDTRTRRYNHKELAKLSFDLTEQGDGDRGVVTTCLAIESHSSLESLYAQEMFSAFMWAAAKTLSKPMKGDAELRLDDASIANSWQSFTLRNDDLSKMAQELESTGLGSLEDIYLSIIPPLSVEHKLPQADAIVELARQQAKRQEQVGHWKEASDIYLWLFRMVRTFPEDSGIAIRATAVLLEYLRQAVLAIDLGEAHHDAHKLQQLKALKTVLEEELNDGAPNIVSNLMALYKEQGRDWTDSRVQQAGSTGVQHVWVAQDLSPADFYRLFRFANLHHVVQFSDWIVEKSIKGMVEGGQDVNARDIHNWTPLHYAAATGCLIPVNLLLHFQADVNSYDLLEWTPLHYACRNGRTSVVRILLQEGAEINFQGRDRVAPLHCAAMSGHQDVLRVLIEAGATVDILDASGNTPLFWAVYKGHNNMVEDLWTDANKKLRDYNGRTAMHLAAAMGGAEMVQLLANKLGADKDARDRNGQTPLHRAAECGHVALVQLLTDKSIGANKEPKDIHKRLPLHSAASAGHEAVVRLLIDELDADMEARDEGGQTPLHAAAKSGQEGVVRLLIQEFSADKEAKDFTGETPLYSAAKAGQAAVARLLIKEFHVDMEAKDNFGQAPLSAATEYSKEAVVRMLVSEFGANTEVRTRDGRTPLHMAAQWGSESMVRLLAEELNADVNADDGNGKTPLSLARRDSTARILRGLGAKE